jgi:type I restriction enzyme, S subunit
VSVAVQSRPARSFTTKPLGEVFDVVGGGTPPKNNASYFSGDIPWATIRDMHSDVLAETEHTISQEGLRNSSAKLIPAGEVIMASRVGLGKACILQRDTAINQDIRALLPLKPNTIDRRFCLYWLQSVKDDIIAAGTGATVQGIKLPFIKSLPFPDVPFEEQKRIVAVLDQAFAALDRARALVEANLADAEEVLSRKLDELFYPAHSARMRTIGEVASIQSGAGFPEKEQGLRAGDYPFYKVSDMNLSGNERYLITANNYINEPVRKRLRASIFPKGSIVFPKVGGAIATNKKRVVEAEGCADNNVMGLIPEERVVLPEYLHEWLFATDIYEFSNKANPPSITQGTVKEWPFFCPDLEEQARIVRLVQTMRGGIRAINEHYRQTVADLGELRQSFLQKAFAGELT